MFESIEESVRVTRLNQLGNPLQKLAGIDWPMFAVEIHRAFDRDTVAQHGGRPRFPDELMFKILVLQRHNDLSDEMTEYLITDRASYRHFLNLASDDRVPDAKTIHRYREELSRKEGLMESLFKKFTEGLAAQGLVGREGVIIDGSFVEAPRQQNSREDNATIKAGEVPAEWKTWKSRHKLRQKDVDARWTRKAGQRHYGYKLHAKVDRSSKLILTAGCSSASLHDTKAAEALLDESDRGKELHADCAYRGDEFKRILAKLAIVNRVNEQGSKWKALTEAQRLLNREKSRVRVRIEHVFGAIEMQMKGSFTRAVGMARNRFGCLLTALTYNMIRRFQIATPYKAVIGYAK